MNPTKERHVGRTYAAFTALFAIVFLWAYSFTPLGVEIEELLFDLRVITKPDGAPVEGVRVLTVSPQSFEKLQAIHPVKIPLRSPDEVDHISVENLERIVLTALGRGYRSVNIVLTVNPYSLHLDEMHMLASLGQRDGRVRIGVLDIDEATPSSNELPIPLRPIDVRVFSADTYEVRTTDIVRKLPLSAYRGTTVRESLAAAIGEYPEAAMLPQKDFLINYVHPDRLLKTDAVDFLKGEVLGSDPTEEDLIFAYGQINNRKQASRYSYVNAPWNDERDDLLQGVYLPDFVAITALNFRHRTFLEKAPWWVEDLQTLLLALLFGFAWVAGSSWAFLIILLTWSGVVLLHGVLFTYANVFVPLGQTTLIAMVAGLIGGQWRLKEETKLRIAEEAETRTKKDFVEKQTLSLSRYAEGLMQLNDTIRGLLGDLDQALPATAKNEESLRILYASAHDLHEYLKGMTQVAGIRRLGGSYVRLSQVAVRALLERLTAQFETRATDKRLTFVLDVKPGFVIVADERILENIIFNFVSNAVRFSPEDGTIRIVAGRRGTRQAFIRVEDEGPGIAAGEEKLIFDKFYQTASELRSELKGHGLGLYLSRFFAGVLKGKVRVVPHGGRGAWVEIVLPLRGGRA